MSQPQKRTPFTPLSVNYGVLWSQYSEKLSGPHEVLVIPSYALCKLCLNL